MITKGSKLSSEIIAQIITDKAARQLKLGRFFPKSEVDEGSDVYTYFEQVIDVETAMKKGQLGEIKPIAPGVSLQELNVRKPIDKSVTINSIGGVLNVNENLLSNNLISVNNMLKDVGSIIGNSIEKETARLLFQNSNIYEYDNGAGLDIPKFIIQAQQEFKEQCGDDVDLNLIPTNYKIITELKNYLFDNNKLVEPIEDIKAYFFSDNIDILGSAVSDGGMRMPEKNYLGFDYTEPPLTYLYSKTAGTIIAPLTAEDNTNDYYPMVELLRKDITDELPKYSKFFIQARVGFLLNKANKAIRGKIVV